MNPEKAILIGVELQGEPYPLEESLAELIRLTQTAGAFVVGSITQKREKPDLKYFVGKGKIEEIRPLILKTGADLLIFDSDLTPSQERNVEEALGIKTIDRTQLILDIFALHAFSHEGRLQVELAQNVYMLTRLSGRGQSMSQLGGGIGTRGPGETKLEKDRRVIRKKISLLKKDIEKVREERSVRRKSRKYSGMPLASLIGYTNSGKSTLINALTKSTVKVEDKLFSTLDTTTKRLYLKSGRTILISDTVGFIQKLPHQLIDAFRATLEETLESDILLHVLDASSPNLENKISAVYTVLEKIGVINKPILTVFNKIDLLDKKLDIQFMDKFKPYVEISAAKGLGIQELKDAIDSCLQLKQ